MGRMRSSKGIPDARGNAAPLRWGNMEELRAAGSSRIGRPAAATHFPRRRPASQPGRRKWIMDALTAQTIQRLRERLAAFRAKGPVPALMVESPTQESAPLPGFADALWDSALRYLPGGANLFRRVWLAADPATVAQLRNICGDAARVVMPALHAAGHHVGTGTSNLTSRWLWAVFELAELRLPGTDLRLDGDTVWRVGAGGVTVGERVLDDPGPFADLAATAGAARYWRLSDAVEASIAVLDIAQTPPGPTQIGDQTAAPPAGRRRRRRASTRAIDVDSALGRLETKMRKELVRELGSESAAESALIDRLYSLSSDDLQPMLAHVGCKTSAKTIRRPGKSEKYASWERYRRPTVPPAAGVDVGPAALSDVRSRTADLADDAVNSGHLSRRTGGRGTTRIGKTAAEKAADDEADRFAREAGIDLPPAE